MSKELNPRITYAQETRLHLALGLPGGPVDPEVLVAAAEGQKRSLEAAVTDTNRRTLAASEGSARELAELRQEVEGLRSQNRLAERERQLDRRDEQDEQAERVRIAAALKIRPDQVI